MDTRGFSYCCGATEIGNFPGDYMDDYTATLAQLTDMLKRIAGREDSIYPRGHMVICTTVPDQTAAIKALRKLKFRVVARYRNGNSGNRVTMWRKLL